MLVVKIDKNKITESVLADAVSVLKAGGSVVHPSESSYGLAVDPRNSLAIKHLFELKGRETGKAVLLTASSFKQVNKVVKLSDRLRRLAKKYWPGPLTIIAPAKVKVDLTATGEATPEIAIRVPDSLWLRELADRLGSPVTSTSVNLSGNPPAFSAQAVKKVFVDRQHKPTMMLDAGRLPIQEPSTLLTENKKGKLVILRQGSLKISE